MLLSSRHSTGWVMLRVIRVYVAKSQLGCLHGVLPFIVYTASCEAGSGNFQ